MQSINPRNAAKPSPSFDRSRTTGPTVRSPTPHRNPPTIALLSDFGTSDHYVGVMKGIILTKVPLARIIDITHEVEPGRIRQGAYALWAAEKHMPRGTVVVAVVDPEVGTERGVVVAQVDSRWFVAPDNGLLDLVLADHPDTRVITVDLDKASKLLLHPRSATFHGRDVFAPLAAHIANGKKILRYGTSARRTVAPWLTLRGSNDPQPTILSVDRFGNIITNISIPTGTHVQETVRMIGIAKVMISVCIDTYADAPDNTPCMIAGSSGLLEIVVRNGSASSMLRATDRTPVQVVWA